MTRAASGAKRSGAAAQYSSRLRVIMPLPAQYFTFSFFVPRTPARRDRRWMWAGRGPVGIAGSVVLHGPGGRTANLLTGLGSVVLFYGPSRDARAEAGRRVRHEDYQNHRTTEPIEKTSHPLGVGGSAPVLSVRLVGTGNKQWGGYAPHAFAASSSADQGLDRAAARGNFSAWARPAGVEVAPIGAIGAVRGNGGFPPFSGVPIGPVGMAMLERAAGMADIRHLRGVRIQPARLAVCDQAPRGVDAGRRGGTPPSAARLPSISQAQPIFRVSSDLRFRWSVPAVAGRRECWGAKTGSGVLGLFLLDQARRAKAALGRLIGWVGVQEEVRSWGREPEAATLWGRLASVN